MDTNISKKKCAKGWTNSGVDTGLLSHICTTVLMDKILIITVFATNAILLCYYFDV